MTVTTTNRVSFEVPANFPTRLCQRVRGKKTGLVVLINHATLVLPDGSTRRVRVMGCVTVGAARIDP